MMKKIAMIPARFAATRFPYKLIQKIAGKSIITHTYENTLKTNLFDSVIVVTDSEVIFSEIENAGGEVYLSKLPHESGTDRIEEIARNIDADIILNVQGDEPFVNQVALKNLLDAFNDNEVQVASLMKPFVDIEKAQNPNIVKVVVDKNNDSIFFSRSPIPFYRDKTIDFIYNEHIGVYAFRKHALLKFVELEDGKLEAAEKIECLRFLENGIKLRMVITHENMIKIDVPEDLEKAIEYYNSLHNL